MVLAITLHEAAHGYVAKLFGDRTAEMLGRVTLNPIKHIDLVGTILVPGLMVLLKAPFVFGWAKPVPVNFGNLRHPKRDMIWVAAAGPGSNLLQAVAWALVLVALAGAGALDSVGLREDGGRGSTGQLGVLCAQPSADTAARRRSHPGGTAAGPARPWCRASSRSDYS